MSSQKTAAEIRADLGHPVIDADGHVFEHYPALHQYCLDEGLDGGLYAQMANCSFNGEPTWSGLSPDERLARRSFRGPWWALPLANTKDFATAVSPALFHDRLEELGMDFAVCYPSIGLNFPAYKDDEVRNKLCRALNRYLADSYQGLQDRLTPVAAIPTHTPSEAIEQLDYAVTELGFKAVMIGGFVPRQVPAGGEMATWIDSLGLDSAYDYDPLWQRLVDLQTPASLHSGSMGWDGRRSISNFTYNHMGNFGSASEATAKSIFFGGVTHRFPDLRLGFLEGGVTWGAQMVCDLLSHWEKRGPEGLKAYDPDKFESDYFDSLLAEANDPIDLTAGFGKMMQKGISGDSVVHDFEAAGIT
ncbi:MAG: amidohydrolase family protein, partial [bacterium]|nr:amidohydrolase family protein [bacterium]